MDQIQLKMSERGKFGKVKSYVGKTEQKLINIIVYSEPAKQQGNILVVYFGVKS